MHYRALVGLAFRLVGNHEDAEDLTQECFVRAHRSLGLFRSDAGLRAWLRRILVHLARDRFRARGARPSREVIDVDALAAREPGPGAAVGLAEFSRLVDAAVERLPDSQRLAFLLRTREGLAYDAIADATGVTIRTARTQVQRARRTLAERLGQVIDARRARRGAGGAEPGDRP